jgi:hypothetical protein
MKFGSLNQFKLNLEFGNGFLNEFNAMDRVWHGGPAHSARSAS